MLTSNSFMSNYRFSSCESLPSLYEVWTLTFCFRIECEEAQEDENEDPNDLPVQGPLPQEPEDAPWKRNDSGVRRL